MATDEIVRGRQCRNASFARHSENRSESGVVSGLAARVTTPLALASDAGGFAAWQARRQAFACHRVCINRLGRAFGTVPSAPRGPPAPRHARSRPWRRAFRVARPWRAGPVDAGDSGSQKDRRRTTALRRLLHCNNSSGTTASGHHANYYSVIIRSSAALSAQVRPAVRAGARCAIPARSARASDRADRRYERAGG